MTLREQLLTVLRGGEADRVPFTCYLSLLPPGGETIPNLALVGTGQAFRTEGPEGVLHSSREVAPGVIENRMETPWGALTQVAHTETGYGSAWTKEHWVKAPEDYAILEQVIRHTEVVAAPGNYGPAREQVGDRGVVVTGVSRTPLQRMWIEYTGIERLVFDLADDPAPVEAVLEALLDQSRQMLTIAAESRFELVWLPDNVTGEVTGPPLFGKYLTTYYRMACDILLPAGKLPATHMDGMLRKIADCIAATDLPVMEAFTPPPDGNFSVREARDQWPGKALWLNFPSSVHLWATDEIKRMTEELVEEAGLRKGFAIGVTENIPASVGTRSLEAIGSVLE